MAIIDVLIVVEATSILRNFGGNDALKTGKYFQLQNQPGVRAQEGEGIGYIYMVTNWMNAQGEGGSELDVFTNPGDTIRWRMTTLGKDNPYQCYITGFVLNSGQNNITPPVPKCEPITVMDIDPTSPGLNRVIPRQANDFYWESTVINKQPVTYHTHFLIFGGGGGGGGGGGDDGGCHGGYQWDPFINKK
jgi:hypothetical protein